MPLRAGSEEYLDSEKYEVKQRKLDGELLPLVAQLNEIRRANSAFQRFDNVVLLETESDELFAFAKRRGSNAVVVVVNLDPHEEREGLAIVPAALGFPPAFKADELLSGAAFTWHTGRNYVKLGPGKSHIVRVSP